MSSSSLTHLDAVVAGCDASVLHLDVGRRMCEFAFGIRAGALIPLELAANLQLQPARVFAIQEVIHIHVDDGGHLCNAVVVGVVNITHSRNY